jgi:hypothetical protein
MKAFPTSIDNGHSENQDGMDLRDYFAARATEQDIKNHERHDGEEISDTDSFGRVWKRVETIYYPREEAKYRYADAMIEARKIRR